MQITENITTLQEQEGCETAILANYAYLADGTKFKATNADGDGFVYTGSLRWRLKDGVLTPESVVITGGRAVCDSTDTWAANYYICDHLGSVRTVTDGNGTGLANYDYLPYGTDMSRDAATADVTDYRFTGKEVQRGFGANLYDSFARFQHNNGRFLSIDPKAESFYHLSPYAYCAGNPVNLVDPDGKFPWAIIWVIYEVGSALYDAYTAYDTLTDKDASTFDKATAVGGVLASVVLPGSGYSAASKVDDVVRIANTADKVSDGAKVYRRFTSSNFRENLIRYTGENPVGYEAHHMLPQKFVEQFGEVGIDIHDPKYGIWLEKIKHSKGSYEYNVKWGNFFKHNSNPTKQEVEEYMKYIMDEVYAIKIE